MAELGPACPPPPPGRSRSVAKKASDRERDKTRVNIGAAFPRWRALRAATGLQLDSELALLLLDHFENGSLASTQPETTRRGVPPPEASNVNEDSESWGATMDTKPKMNSLSVTTADETIHDLPENPGPPAEEILEVLIEEDIIGSRASIVYEENIRQLATLVHLPVKNCPHTTSTGLSCQSLPPFECAIQQRCTAFVVEWVCPRGHVVWSWTSQPTFRFGMLAGDLMLGMNILLSGNSYTKVALLFHFMNMGVVNPVTFFKIRDSYCVDTIKEFWMERRAKAIQRLQDKDFPVSVFPSDFHKVIVGEEEQQLLMVKEEVSPSSVDQEHPEPPHIKEEQEDPEPPHIKEEQEDPEPPHIKEEQEELWSSQEGEQLQGLEEADITKFPFTPVPVKSEDDEEKPQSSQLHQRLTEQMETEADGEDCGGPEPDRNSHPDTHLQPETEDKTGDSSEPETEDSDDWRETREPQSGLNSLKNDQVSEKPFSCSECGKRFGRKKNLHEHVKTHTGEKPFSCSECGKRFFRKTSLQQHMRTHTGERPFSCTQCGKSFSDSGHLKKHMRIHTGEKPYSCSVCKKSFTRRDSLLTHMVIHTGEKPFSCSKCEKRFYNKGNLREHMKSHSGEKTFSCSECGKRFERSIYLKIHMRSHTGEKPFSCSVCKKSFAQSGAVQLHMRTHTGEKPFSCPECDKRFSRKENLKAHMLTHTGEKLFSCSECDKKYILKAYLKKHMKTHLGEKPFSCSECDKGFISGGDLRRHMTIHTGERHPAVWHLGKVKKLKKQEVTCQKL